MNDDGTYNIEIEEGWTVEDFLKSLPLKDEYEFVNAKNEK